MIRNLLTEHISYEELPLSGFEPRYLLAIEQAIRVAWDRLKRSTSAPILATGEEKHITIELQQVLEEIRSSGICEPFTESEFSELMRGAEFMSYDGSHLEKRPDLSICLKTRRPGISSSLNIYDRLFVECKVLDQNNANVSRYAEHGIARFVKGEYAWAMPHSMMVAYVRTDQTLPDALAQHFDRNRGTNLEKYAVKTLPERCCLSRREPRVYFTVHRRSWSYPPGNAPGDIKIRHLWLPVFEAATI